MTRNKTPRELRTFSIEDKKKPSYASRSKKWAEANVKYNSWRYHAPPIDYSKRAVKNPWCISADNIIDTPRRRGNSKTMHEERVKSIRIHQVKRELAPTHKIKDAPVDPSLLAPKEEPVLRNDINVANGDTAKVLEEAFAPELLEQIRRLGGKLPKESNSRPYLDYLANMPLAVQIFCDIQWDHPCFHSDRLSIDVEFAGEFALHSSDLEEIPLLKERHLKRNYVLIGEGTALVVTTNNDLSSDPVIYLAADENSSENDSFNKPMKLSELLCELEVDSKQQPAKREQ